MQLAEALTPADDAESVLHVQRQVRFRVGADNDALYAVEEAETNSKVVAVLLLPSCEVDRVVDPDPQFSTSGGEQTFDCPPDVLPEDCVVATES